MMCKYKDMFGKVNEGIHNYKILNIAVIDVLSTFLGAYMIHMFLPHYKFIYILVALFITGIILHRIFCVRTTIDKILFS